MSVDTRSTLPSGANVRMIRKGSIQIIRNYGSFVLPAAEECQDNQVLRHAS